MIFINSVIIVGGGNATRMNMNINKQFIKINDKEVIAHTIDRFYNNKNIDEIIVVIKKQEENYFLDNIIKKYNYKKIKIAFSGDERQDSVYNGIKILHKNSKIVLIHDGARPFVSEKSVNNLIDEAKKNKACILAVKVKDTIKISQNNEVCSTLKRDELISVQTPQVFCREILEKSYEKAYKENFYGTDDSSLVERLGVKVKVVFGDYNNIKITTKEDLIFANEIIKNFN